MRSLLLQTIQCTSSYVRTFLRNSFIFSSFLFTTGSYAQNCTVNAGGNTVVCDDEVTLSGTVTGILGSGGVTWSFVSGPIVPVIVSSSSLTTSVTGMSVDGVYIFQLSRNCGIGVSVDQVSVTAHPRPASFTAGPDVTNVCATVGTVSLNGVIPSGYAGTWSAENIYYKYRFGASVSTNSVFSNTGINNPSFSLVNTSDHTIDPAYSTVLTITSADGVCTFSDTAVVRFCPNPVLIPDPSYEFCGTGTIYLYMDGTSPDMASSLTYHGAGATGVTYTVNPISVPPGAGTLNFQSIEGDLVYLNGFNVTGTYTFTLSVTSSCCGPTVTSNPVTVVVSPPSPSNVLFNAGGAHPEQMSLYSYGGSGGEVHCGISDVATPEMFYFDINPLDAPSTVTTVMVGGVLPPGASTPIISQFGAGTMNRSVAVNPGASGWKVGTYEFYLIIGTAPCQITNVYFIHVSDQSRTPLALPDQSVCHTGAASFNLTIDQPEVFQEAVNSSYFQGFSGRWDYSVIAKPVGASNPTFASYSDREITDATTTIYGFTLPGDYVFRIVANNGSGVGNFLQSEYACSGITGVLCDTFVVHVETMINANAGSNQSLGCTSSIFLLGNNPGIGTGLWTSVSSPPGATPQIPNPNQPNTVPYDLTVAGNYTFNWQITSPYGACVSSSNITFTVSNVSPNAPTFTDPIDLTQPTCSVPTGAVLLGNLPSSGTWTVTATPGNYTFTGSGTSALFESLPQGVYTFSVSDGVCSSLSSQPATIQAPATLPPGPVVSNPSYCQGEGSVALEATALSGNTLNWYGTNATGGIGSSTAPIPSTVSVGTVTYYVSQTDGVSGCESNRQAIDVTVYGNPGIPMLENLIQPTCTVATGSVELSGLPTSGNWLLSVNGSVVSGTGTTITIGNLLPGNYSLTIEDVNGCSTTSSLDFSVDAQPVSPVPLIEVINPSSCGTNDGLITVSGMQSSAFYTGSYDLTGGGTVSINEVADASGIITLSGLGAGSYSNFTFISNGCISVGNTVLLTETSAPQLTTIPTASICDQFILQEIQGANLSGNEAYCTEQNGLGTIYHAGDILTESILLYAYDIVGNCVSEEPFSIVITQSDDASFELNDFCENTPNQALVLGTPGGVFSFATNPGGIVQINSATGELSNEEGGTTYFIEYRTTGDCPDTTFAQVFVKSTPDAPNVTGQTEYCLGEQVSSLNSEPLPGALVNWYSDNSAQIVVGTAVTFIPELNTQTYYVSQTVDGCESPLSEVSIVINACSIDIPTAFTPDGDQVNDVWQLKDIDLIYPENKVFVYNRWGALLFESEKGNYEGHSWDGKYQDQQLPVGSYYFIIEYNNNTKEVEKGTVTIILSSQN